MKLINRITPVDIQLIFHNKLLRLRSQERLVQSLDFREAWFLASEAEKKEVWKLLRKIKPIKVREWVRNILYGGFRRYSMIELRKLASQNHIKNYSRLSKDDLIYVLTERKIDYGS